MDASLIKLLQGCTTLPSPPAVANKIIELNSSAVSTLNDVADAVSIDPALTVKILRMANSPLYSRHRRIENLRQAILLFGIDGTLNIALSFSLKQSTEDSTASGLDYNAYWKRSLATALLCQEVGQKMVDIPKDSLFLVGLLQNVGVLVLDKIFPDLYKEIDTQQINYNDLCGYEESIIGQDHSDVGVWLLKKWNLSESIIDPISQSHTLMEDSTAQEITSISRCLAAACLLSDIFVMEDTQTAIYNAIEEIQRFTELQDQDFHEIIESVTANFAAMANMFDISIGSTTSLDSIVDQAQEIMMLRNINMMHKSESLEKEADALKLKAEALELATRQDPLTHLYNRRHFDQAIEIEFCDAKKHGWPFGLVFIDLDHFKMVNDTYGHKFGDEVLRKTALYLETCMRDSDTISRYGGEEFVILLPGTNYDGTVSACSRLVKWFEEHPIQLPNSEEFLYQTISAGACVFNENSMIKESGEMLHRADLAVYIAKDEGRNRYCIFDEQIHGNKLPKAS